MKNKVLSLAILFSSFFCCFAQENGEIVVSEDGNLVYDVSPIFVPVTKYIVLDKDEVQELDEEVNEDGIVSVQKYVGGTSIFDYDENAQFPVFTKKLSMTTIILSDDEAMIDTQPFMSDTDSWHVTGDVWETDKGERQLIMLKPLKSGLETNMLLVTNKRLYHFILYSTENDYQPMIRFNYKTEGKFITSENKRKANIELPHYEQVDPSLLSYDYEVKVPIFQKKVMWIPEKVYDDGSHTYIKLPAVVLQNELPTVYEDKENIVNYEVHPTEHNLLIINKLITKLTLRLGKEKITIIKKG